MITSIKADNISAYKALFEEASDILSGYKRVRTYDSKVAAYYYKDAEATEFKNLYKTPVDSEGNPAIKDLSTFAAALAEYSILYVKEGEVVEGFEPMLGITTLEEYFSWLRNLGNIDRKYTVLPLDEEHFEINANTRAIAIPASFKKNGIAVQGDDLAEVLYFKIDRYFDYMDLNNCDIYIQWETPKGPDGQTVKSVSPAYIRDIESEPGKLIFGWAISDAVTANSGNLKFSVRFFQWEDEDKAASGAERILAYSFSTLTVTVPIQAGIAFNPEVDEYVIDDVGNRLIERLENSEIAGGYAAALPVFEKDLDKPNANLIYDLDPTTNTLDLLVQAYSTDTGAITYTWKRQDLDENNSVTGQNIETLVGENVFVEVADLNNLSKSYSYYQQNGSDEDGNPIYTLYTGTIPPSAEDLESAKNEELPENKRFKLYVKQSKVVATKAGVYWAIAENRITNSSSSQLSKKAEFPRPEAIKISQAPVEKGILVENADGEFEFALSVAADNTDGTLSYQWEMDDNYAHQFAGAEGPDFAPIEGANEATYVATKPGHYRVIVTNTRNKSDRVLPEEDRPVSRITYPAQTPIMLGIDKTFYQLELLTDINCPTITLDSSVESDKYTISWYMSEGANDLPIVEDQELPAGVYVASFNPLAYEEKIIELSVGDDIEGAYYAVVTNHVNGSVAKTSKPTYDNMFKVTA